MSEELQQTQPPITPAPPVPQPTYTVPPTYTAPPVYPVYTVQLGPKSVVAILSFSFAILSITFSSLGLLWAAAGIGTGIAGLWDTSSKKAQRGTDSAYRSGAVPPQRGQAKTGRGLAIAGIVVSVVGAAIWWFFILIPMVKAVSDFAAFSTSFPWWRAFL